MSDVTRQHAGQAGGGAALRLLFVLLTITIYQIGTGILAALVPMRLALDGNPAAVIGGVSTAFSAGFIAGCLAAPQVFAGLGARVGLIALVMLNVAATLGMLASDDPAVWGLTRIAAGFSNAAVFVLIEAWLADVSSPSSRGSVFGAYMLLNRVAFALGQLALAWFDPRLAVLFLVSAAAFLLSPLPLLPVAASAPAIPSKAMPDFAGLARTAPAALVGSFFHGLITLAITSLLPVYAIDRKLPIELITGALVAIQLGGLVLQMPMAMLSDRWGRRTIMGLAAALTAAASVALIAATTAAGPWFLLAAFLWGGAPAVIYSIAAAYANDNAQAGQRVPWASAMLVVWGVGAMAGPLAASLLMDAASTTALPVFTGTLSLAFVVFIAWRKIVRAPPERTTPVEAVIGRVVGTPVEGEQRESERQ